MIQNIVILGAGSAGLLTAITLRRKLPLLKVRIVRSREIGVIGVGEGTTPLFPQMLFDYLRLERAPFFAVAQPTWKLGGHFLWGSRRWFDYPFELSFDCQFQGLPRRNGFYCDEEYPHINLPAALMSHGKAFVPRADGWPDFKEYYAFHLENEKLVHYLEGCAQALGVELTEGTVQTVEPGPAGVGALHLGSGERVTADLFVDASGFRSELLGKALGVPEVSYADSLFCDRAVIGGWARTDEPILPYTTQETMSAGWCWQIEHEHFINRGYVFSSRFLADDEAQAEFLRANPRIDPAKTRIVRFSSSRRERVWQGNVVAVGNASGFVEPLEATALTVLTLQARWLTQTLWHGNFDPPPSLTAVYNRRVTDLWDDTRDFLALHYRFNTRLETPFWRTCRAETKLDALAEFLNFYAENGPTPMAEQALPGGRAVYGLDGHLAILIGCQAPYRRVWQPAPQETARWRQLGETFRGQAAGALDVRQTLAAIRHPGWSWSALAPQASRAALHL